MLCLIALQSCANVQTSCSDGWYITGYYTPLESDYQGERTSIIIDLSIKTDFPSSFLRDVKMEGWGKTRFGWYLGYYSNEWHRAVQPLDAKGQALTIGTVSADPKQVALGSQVTIPSNHHFLKGNEFIAADVGQMIRNQHIDIYAGEGLPAKQKTLAFTGQQTVCISH
ncbi:3D domain-containing protein [Reinekea marinisedimentorum]|uniref:3D domain-containing protein n=2 Tax=Reinekea marinisedimentorum TaxID=230495 RepID=A0A4R3I9S2_9GAMM|nr:3D domain-containing protein [Reinekea marinisedimentorum]